MKHGGINDKQSGPGIHELYHPEFNRAKQAGGFIDSKSTAAEEHASGKKCKCELKCLAEAPKASNFVPLLSEKQSACMRAMCIHAKKSRDKVLNEST
jgi:hypothetical protein